MENYEKGEVKELEDVLPAWFPSSAVCMKVNTGSKIRNLMSFALNKMKVRLRIDIATVTDIIGFCVVIIC